MRSRMLRLFTILAISAMLLINLSLTLPKARGQTWNRHGVFLYKQASREWGHQVATVRLWKSTEYVNYYISEVETARKRAHLREYEVSILYHYGYLQKDTGGVYGWIPKDGQAGDCLNSNPPGDPVGYGLTYVHSCARKPWPWGPYKVLEFSRGVYVSKGTGTSSWWDYLNVIMAGGGMSPGEYVSVRVHYRTCQYYGFWWDCHWVDEHIFRIHV